MKLFNRTSHSGEDFLCLVENVKTPLYRTALSMLRNEADALDAVSETVCKAYSSFPSLREKQLGKTWITRILINHCNDLLRKKGKVVSFEELPSHISAASDSGNIPEYVLGRPMEELLLLLPEDQRTILLLRYVSDLPLKDISEVLKLPLGTVKTRLYNGLKTLRIELQEEEQISG